MNKVDILAITISSPLQIGIYKENRLVETVVNSGKTSDILPVEIDKILKRYQIGRIFYTKGPGGFMAIKLAYVFFKTLSIVKGIKLFGVDGFVFNNNYPIPSIGKMCFVKEEGEIKLKKSEDFAAESFTLPPALDVEKFSESPEPLYIAPAV